MKKLSKIFALLIFVGFNSFAQKAELQSAMNYVKWNDLEKAKKYYSQLIENFPGSSYTVEARKRFRKLRGDNL